MKPYLRIEEDPGSSMSFLIGDTFREAFFKPWKLFFLPLMLYRRIRNQRVAQQSILESNVEILYLIDAESLLDNEFKMFEQILASRGNDLIASVGDFGTIMDFSIPSRKSNSDTKQQWNNDLEKFVESLIISRRPKKLIFIGKYPYAGPSWNNQKTRVTEILLHGCRYVPILKRLRSGQVGLVKFLIGASR